MMLSEPTSRDTDSPNDIAVNSHAQNRSLRAFTGHSYEKGRSTFWQATWFATMNVLFSRWWCPAALRPLILTAFGAQVGRRVLIRHRVRVLWPWKLTIGDDSWIGEGAWLLNLEPIHIGSDVCISQEAFLCTGSHDRDSPSFEYDNGPITIGDESWIGAQALILRGVRVGRGAVVGARSTITRDISEHATVRAGETR
jgi:putative colanic acid biosynthesis acetyltransferase WcaF